MTYELCLKFKEALLHAIIRIIKVAKHCFIVILKLGIKKLSFLLVTSVVLLTNYQTYFVACSSCYLMSEFSRSPTFSFTVVDSEAANSIFLITS